jgi:N-carbamoylputrescine amidase
MVRMIKSGLIQCSLPMQEGEGSVEEIKEAMFNKHIPFIDEAGEKGVQILCLQEIFNTPYFCPSQDTKWYKTAERIPEGPTTQKLMEYAKKYEMVIIAPIYEGTNDRSLL